MCKKVFFVVGFVVVVGLAGNATAAISWDNDSGDNLWKTPENWSANIVPTDANIVNIKMIDANECVIDATHTGPDAAVANKVRVGNSGNAGDMRMTGGSLTVIGNSRVGNNAFGRFYMEGGTAVLKTLYIAQQAGGDGSFMTMTGGSFATTGNIHVGRQGGTGTLNIDGGTFDVGGDLRIGKTNNDITGTGTVIITAGVTNVGDDLQIALDGSTGHLQLDGGTIKVSGDLDRESGGTIDITGGTLVLSGDQESKVEGYASDGWITAYGGNPRAVKAEYDSGTNKTTVTADMSILALAWNPNPEDGESVELTPASPTVTLSWSDGDYVAGPPKHRVFFSDKFDDVNGGVGGTTQNDNSYPIVVDLDKTYYWRIDEANATTSWDEGEVWSFEVGEYVLVDDFEAYEGTSPPNDPNLLGTWADGSANGTGSTISLGDEFVGNSMECVYDNNQSPFYSEAELTYDAAGDWTAAGVKALELWFHGDVNNLAEQMYVILEDAGGKSAVVVHDDPNALIQEDWEGWQVWNIALQDYVDANDVNLAGIKKVTIGIGDGVGIGGSGVVSFDDIRLYPPRCLPEYVGTSFDNDCVTGLEDLEVVLDGWLVSDYNVTAQEPNDNRLQAYYKFDETSGTNASDSSDKGRHATVDANGADAWDANGYDDYCLDFNGTFGVSVPNDVFSGISGEVTISMWVHVDVNVNPNTIGRAEFGAGPADPNEWWDRLTWIQEEPEDYIGQWSHYAFVKDSDDGMMRMYHNGLLVAQNVDATQLMDGAEIGPSVIGSAVDANSGYYEGKLDEFKIYDYALSHAEVLYLAKGGGSELYQPLQPVLSPVDPYVDGRISFKDFAVLAEVWLEKQLWP